METNVSQALDLQLCTIPGGRDRERRPIILINVREDTHTEYKEEFVLAINYLLTCFRQPSLRNGLTIVVNAVESGWRVVRTYIRYISETVSKELVANLIVLRPDAFWDKQRVEKCIKSQNEISVIYIPKERLIKFIDVSQIPESIGGKCKFYNHATWMQDRSKIEEWKADVSYAMIELNELRNHLVNNCSLRSSEIESALSSSLDASDSAKMFSQTVIDAGKELLIKFQRNAQRWSIENGDFYRGPQDTLDAITTIEILLGDIDKENKQIDESWKKMEKCFEGARELSVLEDGVTKVINWILTVGEEMCNQQHSLGFDVASAEDLRLQHEMLELECWNTYGRYAELSYKIESISSDSVQYRDLSSQKAFMDFVCRSFATRLERRRNLLITSLRLFRLLSQYFDRTSEVFETLVMENSLIEDLDDANTKFRQLQESQQELEVIECELVKEGEKLSDMLSMPVKNALGADVGISYEEEIVNVRDVLDATRARKNIFIDSVELQKVTLEKVTHILMYENDIKQAIQWLNDLLNVVLHTLSHVGCNVHEIQMQKDELQSFQQTVKCTYNFGCQLLNAILTLRQSCQLPIQNHVSLSKQLHSIWQTLQQICQEQMTRLRVSAVFHRSLDEYCNQIKDLRDAVSGSGMIKIDDPHKKKERVKKFMISREHLLMEVGRMVRLGRMLKSRLKEPLNSDGMADDPDKLNESSRSSQGQSGINLNEGNATAIESISDRLSEVTGLAEELDMALRGAQQDCALNSPTPSTVTPPIKKIFDGTATTTVSSTPILVPTDIWFAKKTSPVDSRRFADDSNKSDDEFLTASECTIQSRSSSFHTASECGALSPWWELDRSDKEDTTIQKEKMVIAVGIPELPDPKTVLKPSPEVPAGKVVHEVTETTHLKVNHSHTLGVSSYVLTSETVKNGNEDLKTVSTHSTSTVKEVFSDKPVRALSDRIKYIPEGREDLIVPVTIEKSPQQVTKDDGIDELLLKQVKEVSYSNSSDEQKLFVCDDINNAWCKYYNTYVAQQTIKGCL